MTTPIGKFLDNEVIVLQKELTPTKLIVVSRGVMPRTGKEVINVKEFWRYRDDPDWYPAKGGLLLPIEHAPEIVAAMQKALTDPVP